MIHTHQDRNDGLCTLHSVAGLDLDPVGVLRLAVQGVPESEGAGGGVQLEPALVPGHDGVAQGSGGVGVGGAEGGHHLSSGQVLGHGELVGHVPERGRTVVLVQDFDADLEEKLWLVTE